MARFSGNNNLSWKLIFRYFYWIAAFSFLVPLFLELSLGLMETLWVTTALIWSLIALYRWLSSNLDQYRVWLTLVTFIVMILGVVLRFIPWLYK